MSEKDLYENTLKELVTASELDEETCAFVIKTYACQSKESLISIGALLAGNQLDEAAVVLHKLKGSSGNVRATAVMELARAAEGELKAKNHEKLDRLLVEIGEKIDAYEYFSRIL